MGSYIWYSEEKTGRECSLPSPLLAVPNVTAHSSTVSVPITAVQYSMLLCDFNLPIKGLIFRVRSRYYSERFENYDYCCRSCLSDLPKQALELSHEFYCSTALTISICCCTFPRYRYGMNLTLGNTKLYSTAARAYIMRIVQLRWRVATYSPTAIDFMHYAWHFWLVFIADTLDNLADASPWFLLAAEEFCRRDKLRKCLGNYLAFSLWLWPLYEICIRLNYNAEDNFEIE